MSQFSELTDQWKGYNSVGDLRRHLAEAITPEMVERVLKQVVGKYVGVIIPAQFAQPIITDIVAWVIRLWK
jgi:hypothetical protein